MWKLIKEDGEVYREGLKNQWECLVTSFKGDGSRFTKKEAMELPSGTVCYKKSYFTVHYERPQLDANGFMTANSYYGKEQRFNMMKLTMIEY